MGTRKVLMIIVAIMVVTSLFSSCENQNTARTEVYSITKEEADAMSETVATLSSEYIHLVQEIANVNLQLDQMYGILYSNKESKGNKAAIDELKKKVQLLKRYLQELKNKAGKHDELVSVIDVQARSLEQKEREIARLYNEINKKNETIDDLYEELRLKNAMLERKNRELEEQTMNTFVTAGDELIDVYHQMPSPNTGLFKGRLSRGIEEFMQMLLERSIRFYDQAVRMGSTNASYKKAEALKLLQTTQKKTQTKQSAIRDDVYY